MPTHALTGKATIQLNGRVFNDFADGEVAHLTVPEDLMTVKTGKNGNAIYAFKYQGQQVELSLRLLRGSSDDVFLNNLLALLSNDPPAFTLMTGAVTQNIGDGQGNIKSDTYILSGGTFKKKPEVMESADGDVNQAVVVYNMIFSNGPRSIS